MKSSVLANTIENPPTVLFYFGMTFFLYVSGHCIRAANLKAL